MVLLVLLNIIVCCRQDAVSALCNEAGVVRVSDYSNLQEEEVDIVFVCVKTYSLDSVAAQMAENKVFFLVVQTPNTVFVARCSSCTLLIA